MLPGLEMAACSEMAVPMDVMRHIVNVESSYNPYAIGVVGGRLVRQPKSLGEALSTVKMLEEKGYNFSVGLAQVNRYNLNKYGLDSYEKAFQQCSNLQAGSRILAECYSRSGRDWGKSFSCYYSGNFVTGYRHGYVQKIFASLQSEESTRHVQPIELTPTEQGLQIQTSPRLSAISRAERRVVKESAERGASQSELASALQEDPAYVVAPASGSRLLRGSALRAIDGVMSNALSNALGPKSAVTPADSLAHGPAGRVLDDEADNTAAGQASEGPVTVRAWNSQAAPSKQATKVQTRNGDERAVGDSAFVF
ncbi:type IV secretion system protein VirB1 [Xanthomonas arboricola]|uniref:lytic transglycosylase domain-containing protein n=1 Tax=Xanthomonas campestris TaxID=339 RepID=UPI0023E98953|nr:type IV secretion system protein VirB1 [Xanthomonas campestris]MCW2005004.1 type IV secretion system protein VirB1 [Xanthomonas campestris]